MNRHTTQKMKDGAAIGFGVLFLLFVLLMIPLNIWLHFFAPCEYVDWMPTKDVPNRCADFDK